MAAKVVEHRSARRLRFALRSEVRCDWLTLRLPGEPALHGFGDPDDNGCFYDAHGWRATTTSDPKTKLAATYATKSGVECYVDPAPLERFKHAPVFSVTRYDVCRECEGLPVTRGMECMFAGNRDGSGGSEQSRSGRTVYVGSRGGAWFLRVYEKESNDGRLWEVWTAHGWTGGDLTRVEFELRRRMIDRLWPDPVSGDIWHITPSAWQLLLHRTWADCLTRCRLCLYPPENFAKNANAPTDGRWQMLGERLKQPVQKVKLRGGPDPALVQRTIERYLAQGLHFGDLERVVATLRKTR